MPNFSSLLNHLAPRLTLTQEEEALFTAQLRLKTVRRRQLVEQPGYVSTHRTYVVNGALRAFLVGADGQEHTLYLAVDGWFIGDPGSFLFQQPATLFVEALENSTLIQWSYESEQLLLQALPRLARVMMERAQQIAVLLLQRVIAHLNLSAEERYTQFARDQPQFMQRIPLYIIASYLGMSREFLSKIRKRHAERPIP